MVEPKRQCSQRVYSGRGEAYPCQKQATVEREGKWYCTIHNPEYIEEKQRKWEDKFRKKCAESRTRDDRIQAMREAYENLTTEELLKLNPTLLRAAPVLYEALKIVIAELNDAQGEWVAVSEEFAPSWTYLIKSAVSQLEAAIAKAENKQEV